MRLGPLFLLAHTPAGPASTYRILAPEIFLVFFIMLGPLKAIVPFFMATRSLDAASVRALAWKVFALGSIAVVLGGWIGARILLGWQIEPPIMQVAGGLIFLSVSFKLVMQQYEEAARVVPPSAPSASASASERPNVMQLVFPITVPPYGIAALILLLAMSSSIGRTTLVLSIALVVMLLNLFAMLFARSILRVVGPVPLQFLAAVLGVLQVALALQILAQGLEGLGLRLDVDR